MKGEILDYSIQTNSGIISGDDGNRYSFTRAEWKAGTPPTKGLYIDFEAIDREAHEIYIRNSPVACKSEKNKTVAGLLAIFVGGFGIHKFYLGFTGPGLVYLLTNTIGWVITFWLMGIPNMILGVMTLIEGIIYLTRTDEDFEQTYVVGKKKWF